MAVQQNEYDESRIFPCRLYTIRAEHCVRSLCVATSDAQHILTLRDDSIRRLVAMRATIDPNFERISDADAASHFGMLLDRLQSFTQTKDADQYTNFARTYLVARVAEGFSHESIVGSVVATGDVVVEAANEAWGNGPQLVNFVRSFRRLTFAATRIMVDSIAAQFDAVRGWETSL